ncbi:MAG: sulfotransferase domain-containing protein [Myxococcota bacterium]
MMRPSTTTSRLLGITSQWLDVAVRNLDNARRIINFLHGRDGFVVRPDDVFVASYPRSGTTLTQWIAYLLAHGDEGDPEHLTQVSPWFERSLAIGEHTARSFESFPSPRIFKSHLPRAWLPDGARYVYVERDGQDVLLSYYHLYRDYLGFEGTLDDFYRRFIGGRVQYGSWFDHLEGWRAHESDADVLMVRYEDLVANRRQGVERIGQFLGLGQARETLERALELSSFEAMKTREAVFDHATALLLERGVRPRSFIRTGHAGGGAKELSEVQRRAFKETGSTGRPPAIRELAAFLQ